MTRIFEKFGGVWGFWRIFLGFIKIFRHSNWTNFFASGVFLRRGMGFGFLTHSSLIFFWTLKTKFGENRPNWYFCKKLQSAWCVWCVSHAKSWWTILLSHPHSALYWHRSRLYWRKRPGVWNTDCVYNAPVCEDNDDFKIIVNISYCEYTSVKIIVKIISCTR